MAKYIVAGLLLCLAAAYAEVSQSTGVVTIDSESGERDLSHYYSYYGPKGGKGGYYDYDYYDYDYYDYDYYGGKGKGGKGGKGRNDWRSDRGNWGAGKR